MVGQMNVEMKKWSKRKTNISMETFKFLHFGTELLERKRNNFMGIWGGGRGRCGEGREKEGEEELGK